MLEKLVNKDLKGRRASEVDIVFNRDVEPKKTETPKGFLSIDMFNVVLSKSEEELIERVKAYKASVKRLSDLGYTVYAIDVTRPLIEFIEDYRAGYFTEAFRDLLVTEFKQCLMRNYGDIEYVLEEINLLEEDKKKGVLLDHLDKLGLAKVPLSVVEKGGYRVSIHGVPYTGLALSILVTKTLYVVDSGCLVSFNTVGEYKELKQAAPLLSTLHDNVPNTELVSKEACHIPISEQVYFLMLEEQKGRKYVDITEYVEFYVTENL